MDLDGDWRNRLDDTDARLVDGFQSGFPVEERPFRAVARALDTTEDDVLERVERLLEMGVFRRFGAVLNPPVIGSSTLAAVRAPDDRFEEIAETINAHRQVNHNYRRDHEYNMWFVVTAASKDVRDRILADIERETGCEVLDLPMLTDYYIDLEFPVMNTDRFAREALQAPPTERAGSDGPPVRERLERTDVTATRLSETARSDLSALERTLILEIQNGFPLTATPYADIADAIGADTDDVLAAVDRLLADNCIKRVGCVVNHVATGFTNNCMVVWDVPDDDLDAYGQTVGELPYVTLCYHRPRRPDQDWPYNLFTMVHGRDPDAVDGKIDELATDYLPVPHERLYSTEKLKQTGAQYEELV
ncbi:Lrp/AsnC family transcriptional regulator [Salarchaeum sp. JOR-1]|uniref:siroheme decarboxylase subunit beta n=1 Tax=Salarchaeum sp. JOR-1 TaxID=2599399 RepID=UPI00119842B1|nr:Lrp/AsnC family transcriptional regulator [Salarchaeum sp. JOR-1]QDX40574.1 Lrp/AsnC family transcriptional regulator [Salarchaeum sp. JOR-1]